MGFSQPERRPKQIRMLVAALAGEFRILTGVVDVFAVGPARYPGARVQAARVVGRVLHQRVVLIGRLVCQPR